MQALQDRNKRDGKSSVELFAAAVAAATDYLKW